MVKTVQQNEVTVVCNGRGCSIPEMPQLLLNQTLHKATEENEDGENSITVLTNPLEIYFEKLKRMADEHVTRGNRVKRAERNVRNRGNVRFNVIELQINDTRRNNSQDTKHKSGQDIHTISQLDTNKPRVDLKKTQIKFEVISDGLSENFSHLSSPNKNTSELDSATSSFEVKDKSLNTPRLSRSDSDYDESNFDYIQTTKHNRGKAKHYSLFKNPVYDDDNTGIYEQIVLGGTSRDYEGTTPFPIVDVDHDYDQEYEYVKLNNQNNDEPKEEEEVGNTRDFPEEGTEEGGDTEESMEENEDEEGNESGEKNEDDKQVEEVEVKKQPMVTVVYKEADDDDDVEIRPSFQYGQNPDIQERYISKDPLAGPGATRGFNHDFQPLRGVNVGGNVVVQPTRYPTVPGFNTKEIHNIIKTGQIPGTPGLPGRPNWNSTKIGIIPIEPARHARPNDLGQYLGPPPPYSQTYGGRRPPGVASYPFGKGVRKPLYSYGPVRSQKIILTGRHPRYRPPLRGGPHLSYHVRGRNHVKLYRPVISSRPTVFRVNVLEERTSNEEPIIVEPPDDTIDDEQFPERSDTDYSNSSGREHFEENGFHNDEHSNNNYSKLKTLTRQAKAEKSISPMSSEVNEDLELNPSKTVDPNHTELEKRNEVKRKLTRRKNIIRKHKDYSNENVDGQHDTFISHNVDDNEGHKQEVHRSVGDVNDSTEHLQIEENNRSIEEPIEEIKHEHKKHFDKKAELSQKISKIIEQTDETPIDENSNEDSISYNNHWTLEYYYPT